MNTSIFIFKKTINCRASLLSLRCLYISPPIQNQTKQLINTDFYGYKSVDPTKGNLVYVGTLKKSIKLVKGFSLITSGIALAFQPMLYSQMKLASSNVLTATALLTTLFIFCTPVFLHLVTKRYVTSIYYNEDKNIFTATTLTLFLQTKTHIFTPQEITVPNISVFTTVVVKGTPLFVDSLLFVDKKALITFMKYDEPIDWKIENKDADNEKEK